MQKFYIQEYLWKDDKKEHLRQFLRYNRLLSEADLEQEKKAAADPANFKPPDPSPPNLSDFKAKVSIFS